MAILTAPFEKLSMSEILDDLATRFIINVPPEELKSIQRVCFQIEQAHWFYEDYIREVNQKLQSCNLKQFSLLMFQHCPLLQHWAPEHERAFNTFMQYKVRVPGCGAILLNEDLTKILLVRGWKSSAAWGFPKGKINQGESETSCAIREVFEETGFDVSTYIRSNEYIERVINDQRMRLYIISGINENIQFTTQTRKEIGDIKWHDIINLPGFDNSELDRSSKFAVYTNNKKYKYYLVTPFVSSLRKWIQKYKKARKQGKARKDAALKVVMDSVAQDSDIQTSENYDSTGEHFQDYHGAVPKQQQVHLEDSLKKLLGITPQQQLNDWDVAAKLANSLPDPNRAPPTPFGTMPGMELPSNYSQEFLPPKPQTASSSSDNAPSEIAADVTEESEVEPSETVNAHKSSLLEILVGNKTSSETPKKKLKKVNRNKKSKKLEYSQVRIQTRPTSPSRLRADLQPKPQVQKKESILLDLLVNSPKDGGLDAKLASHTDGLLKLLIQTSSPKAADPGLESALSGHISATSSFKPKIAISPLSHEKQSLEDILRGAPPLPVQPQGIPSFEAQRFRPSKNISETVSSPRGNLLADIILNPPAQPNVSVAPPEKPRLFKKENSHSKIDVEKVASSSANPFAGSLLDILTTKPSGTLSQPEKKPKGSNEDLLNLLLNPKK